MRELGVPVLVLMIAGACGAASAQVSLKTVVDLARRNSTAVRMAQADVDKARAILSESKDVAIPSVQLSTGLPVFPEVGFTGTPPSLWSATVQSVLFSVPQKRYIDAAKLGLEAATEKLKDASEQVALDASTAYIEFDTVNRDLEVAHAQQEFAERLTAIVQERAEAGVDPMSELLEARLRAAEVKLRREHLEARAASLAKQLAVLTGLPLGSILPDHASIPEIPAVHGEDQPPSLAAVNAAQLMARSKQKAAQGDRENNYLPQLSFGAQYYRGTNLLNSEGQYFATHTLPANNFFSGISISVPLFDMEHRAKAKESAADALRATVEAEDAQKQNDVQIAMLNGSLRELDTLAEIAGLKQQIAAERLKTVATELTVGNGAGNAPGAPAQLTPKAEQLAHIDERQKYQDALDAALELAKARLGLLRALGHMEDWLRELHSN